MLPGLSARHVATSAAAGTSPGHQSHEVRAVRVAGKRWGATIGLVDVIGGIFQCRDSVRRAQQRSATSAAPR